MPPKRFENLVANPNGTFTNDLHDKLNEILNKDDEPKTRGSKKTLDQQQAIMYDFCVKNQQFLLHKVLSMRWTNSHTVELLRSSNPKFTVNFNTARGWVAKFKQGKLFRQGGKRGAKCLLTDAELCFLKRHLLIFNQNLQKLLEILLEKQKNTCLLQINFNEKNTYIKTFRLKARSARSGEADAFLGFF